MVNFSGLLLSAEKPALITSFLKEGISPADMLEEDKVPGLRSQMDVALLLANAVPT
jgi:hypothetical protein